ncbi:branched-chain amino acid aminotransferase [Nanchangia anserum]|uniref:branched-chain-amino-acid transaminase n=1 Tax=Nanchangia anserum TaxID=2692125 RepID=A0A8I0GDL0_9ACTO|nr:branched-chain amino acid aminotransferase [Nanchangia anserum]MBD3688917.1 branched-chain amino acid aminotransferase [Nanchangia anserum]QOX81181.1 branched-chain amino acid aminotransferase [Nanchangia anserum]
MASTFTSITLAETTPASADELAGRFPLTPNPHPADDDEYARIMRELRFGMDFTDHMVHAHWSAQTGWGQRETRAYGPLTLSPAATIFHYGQECFEGIKAYRHADGSIWTFRPGYNAARFAASARRLCLPELEPGDFEAALVDLVRADARWVPTGEGSSLYLRPFMIGTEPHLGVHPAAEVDFYCIASPSGPYFATGFDAVSIGLVRDYHRAGPGGTGAAKTGGNYAASLLPQQLAAEQGFSQVCFLDVTGTYLEELGGMNLFVVGADGSVRTPRVDTGTVLEGGTRHALIQLMKDEGIDVAECDIALTELVQGMASGEVRELFACGTAAVITPIGRLACEDFDVSVPTGELTRHLYDRLTGIQLGREDDPHGWMYKICD